MYLCATKHLLRIAVELGLGDICLLRCSEGGEGGAGLDHALVAVVMDAGLHMGGSKHVERILHRLHQLAHGRGGENGAGGITAETLLTMLQRRPILLNAILWNAPTAAHD